MKETVKITGCYQKCPFYEVSMDGMQCNHPYWIDKGAYANMIISQEYSRGGDKIPKKCPLRISSLNRVYKLKR